MSEQNKTPAAASPATPAGSNKPIPSFVPEDMIEFWLWFREKGVKALALVCAVAIVVAGAVIYLRYRESQTNRASEQLAAADSVESIEAVVAQYGNTAPGVAARLKLSKAYYDAGKYQEALTGYDSFLQKYPAHPFADLARVGRGFALCALNRPDDALTAFHDFEKAKPDSFLEPQVMLGEVNCLTIQGKKAEAKALLQKLRVLQRDTPWEGVAKRMEGVVDRYTAQAPRSLFDQANALAPLLPSESPVVQPPAIKTPVVSGQTNAKPLQFK
jgi:outer membrane protein assembly factor BamD (BamD/ComL family)